MAAKIGELVVQVRSAATRGSRRPVRRQRPGSSAEQIRRLIEAIEQLPKTTETDLD